MRRIITVDKHDVALLDEWYEYPHHLKQLLHQFAKEMKISPDGVGSHLAKKIRLHFTTMEAKEMMETIQKLYNEGMAVKEIRSRLGVSSGVMYGYLGKLSQMGKVVLRKSIKNKPIIGRNHY